LLTVAVALMITFTATPASATWSVVAVDPETGEVGAAMASCASAGMLGEPDQVLVPVVLVPQRGVGLTQGLIDPAAPVGLRQLLGDGASPETIIAELLAIDEQPEARQFGIATLPETAAPGQTGPEAVAVTGSLVEGPAADGDGELFAAQGLLLASDDVIDSTVDAFVEARRSGTSLADALVAGLVAGAEAGGDKRCDADQTALFAHLAVAAPGDDPLRPSTLITVTVDEGDGQNPVVLLDQALSDGGSGWVDAGLREPTGIPRAAVLAVAFMLSIAAVVVLRAGMGNTKARR
jgi:uncharacterized Ntn-hydrolase superfamily protein